MTDFDTTAQDGNLDLISLAQSGDRDALEQLIILGNGALRVSSREFYYEVTQAEEEIRSIISETF